MGYIVASELEELHLPSDPKWVVMMRRKMSYDAELAMQDALIKINAEELEAMAEQARRSNGNGHGKAKLKNPPSLSKVELAASVKALTFHLIDTWNLTDERDDPLPLTPENLGKLEPEDGRFLAEKARERIRVPEERIPFGKRSGSRSAPSPASAFKRHGG